jgi:hypothetical protein
MIPTVLLLAVNAHPSKPHSAVAVKIYPGDIFATTLFFLTFAFTLLL